MKMKTINIKLLGLALAISTTACDNSWMQDDVPEQIKVQLSELYPNVKSVEWDQEDDGYEAEFELGGRERSVLFSLEGKLIEVTEEIGKRGIPAPALAYVQQHFADYTLDEVHRVSHGSNIRYVVELERQNQDAELTFDENGALLKGSEAAASQIQTASLASMAISPPEELVLPKPQASWQLPAALREVSGIALLPDNLMACIQDEEGAIFIYDLGSKKIERKINFAGPGDYEEIALDGTTAYVLRSDGAVFEVDNFLAGKPKVTEHKSVLASTQDTEGLAYDDKNKRLLIACKGFDKKLGSNKGIYSLELSNKQMQLEPVIRIPLAQNQLQQSNNKKKDEYDVLQPSSLEVHPQTGELYLLDAANQRLMVLDESGKIQRSVSLDKELMRQPEGLAFSQSGEMYIASEGSKKGSGVILKYDKGL